MVILYNVLFCIASISYKSHISPLQLNKSGFRRYPCGTPLTHLMFSCNVTMHNLDSFKYRCPCGFIVGFTCNFYRQLANYEDLVLNSQIYHIRHIYGSYMC